MSGWQLLSLATGLGLVREWWFFFTPLSAIMSLLGIWYAQSGSDGKESACNTRDPGLIPGSGRSPREGNDFPLQYSCLENPVDRGRSLTGCRGLQSMESQWVRHDWVTFTVLALHAQKIELTVCWQWAAFRYPQGTSSLGFCDPGISM